ncbi:hypothetical protein [Ahrensia sp. R2A130]|uniref:hypothetical protein n=1 Tax=Ahrensia sp. R2A130 TaxID=744979 RepID=UPI0001E0ACB8|nr:hypothetical protein [Ahrensia sp. R2A130]EFL88679.1 conserved hypothetical protein [Ahrensia sp. R2A130]
MLFFKPDKPALYEYVRHDRGPFGAIIIVLIVSAIFLAFQDPEAVLPLLLITPIAALLVWWISSKRTCGMKITEGNLHFHAGRSKKAVPRPLIERVEIKKVDGGADVQMKMMGGTAIDLPPHCQPDLKTLKAALQDNGFVVLMV